MFLRLQEAAHGLIRLITIAPETAHAMDFISELHEQIHISLGHTASDYDTAYEAFGLDVDVKGNRATLADGTLAGSVTNLMDCMRTAVSMGIPLETAVRCATYNPARSIGVENRYGRIAPGAYGDCVLLSRSDLAVQRVILGGEIVK